MGWFGRSSAVAAQTTTSQDPARDPVPSSTFGSNSTFNPDVAVAGSSRLPLAPSLPTPDTAQEEAPKDLPWFLTPTSSTRDRLLPLSGGLFVASLGLTVLISLRRYKRLEAKELAEAAKSGGTVAGEAKGIARAPGVLQRPGGTSSGASASTSTAPSALRSRGDANPSAVLGAARPASVPSALSSSRLPSTSSSQNLSGVGLASLLNARQTKGKETEGEEDDLGPNPVLYTLKAFGVATAIVASAALLGVEVGKRVLGVGTMDELVHLLSTRVPSLVSSPRSLAERTAVSSRSMLEGVVPASVLGAQDPEDSPPPPQGEAAGWTGSSEPRPTQEVFDELGRVARGGEGWKWLEILDEQLVKERRRDEEDRKKRLGLLAVDG